MITINLLPREVRRKKAQVKVPQAATVALVILAAGGLWGYRYLVQRDVERLQADIVVVRNEITQNQQIIRVVEQYTRDKKQLQDRLTLIQQLVTAQSAPVRLLDGISRALPEGAWLNGISKTSGKLVVKGYASSHFAVAELMLALQQLQPIVTSIELNFSEFEVYEGKPVERFEILATLTG